MLTFDKYYTKVHIQNFTWTRSIIELKMVASDNVRTVRFFSPMCEFVSGMKTLPRNDSTLSQLVVKTSTLSYQVSW